MIDISTGKEMTRGGFLKGILASGIAPSITLGAIAQAGSANASVGGMMRGVGARNSAMFTKPYDAEVEYLGSTGTQYINTQVNSKWNINFDVSFQNTEYTSKGRDRRILCGGEAWNINVIQLCENYFAYDTYDISKNVAYNYQMTTSVHRAYFYNRYFNIDDIYKRQYQNGSFVTGFSISLFCHTLGVSHGSFFVGRIYYAKIGDVTTSNLRDLIPVRVGSGDSAVGYMYDRVSGKLFGNAGTGAFILGPDKV